MVNKKNILFMGIVAMFVNIAILAVLFYVGFRSGGSFFSITKILSKEIYLEFHLINFIFILLLSMTLNSKMILRCYMPLILLSLIMVFFNALLIPKSFIPIFNTIFWVFYLVFLYFNKKALKAEKAEI